ncbi:hypothetical protein EXIGLDRAFT_722203 [Exidia glandulosa HHB12029]|uniref:Uncharacterized protein n=1 Tax=Exidia glandulosa HHB12029 TaxID=1314781 RepID=A0A165FDP7_EXIGL|nr:hypothetical protein EXIGLDRAFT_722203 [Exidia glandulosa HHB12029]
MHCPRMTSAHAPSSSCTASSAFLRRYEFLAVAAVPRSSLVTTYSFTAPRRTVYHRVQQRSTQQQVSGSHKTRPSRPCAHLRIFFYTNALDFCPESTRRQQAADPLKTQPSRPCAHFRIILITLASSKYPTPAKLDRHGLVLISGLSWLYTNALDSSPESICCKYLTLKDSTVTALCSSLDYSRLF